MKNKKTVLLVASLAFSVTSFAQLPKAISSSTAPKTEAEADSSVILLDKAISTQATGNNEATAQALSASVTKLEKQTANSSGDFKDKLTGQIGNLKNLIPLAKSGLLKGDMLQKAISMVKMALGANQISSLLGGKNLLSNAAGLTSNLNLMKGGLSALGGESANTGGSLINAALSNVNLLKTGGAAAEPAARKSLGGVLDFAKGLL
jgi:hypothetical protein